ncbi:neutral zinc metallopeptidase [Planomonospora sp. ID67723]|uniref:neutral zinc metallopeptidase n=1 Tax=Planomonospora sp. ID67723 TaxID=2738134 RepID=UPI0018C426EF|nr:neutral zinc metallopeptidase [Planomonospora sp. ID67723]MBG0830829.1 neutral zinc metallopeptidase [Planomonospora sp. ID67723]
MNALPSGLLPSLAFTSVAFCLVTAGGSTVAAGWSPVAGGGESGVVAVSAVKTAPARTVVQGRAAATANPLYRTGRMPAVRCSAGTIRPGSAASYRSFMTRVNGCLGRAWAAQFKKAGLPFTPPRLRFVSSRVSSPCGGWPAGAGGYYCSGNRTMYIGVTRKVLKNPYGPNHAQFMAHEYAHHVQQLAGIMPYYGQAAWSARSSARLALSRRLELQADCLASAFLRGAADDLEVTREHWNAMIEWTAANGHKTWPTNDHGKGRSQAFWMQRGFRSGSPASCNTWTASVRSVG